MTSSPCSHIFGAKARPQRIEAGAAGKLCLSVRVHWLTDKYVKRSSSR